MISVVSILLIHILSEDITSHIYTRYHCFCHMEMVAQRFLIHALLEISTITSIRSYEEGVVSVDVDKTIDMETGRRLLVRRRVGPLGMQCLLISNDNVSDNSSCN